MYLSSSSSSSLALHAEGSIVCFGFSDPSFSWTFQFFSSSAPSSQTPSICVLLLVWKTKIHTHT